MLLDFSPGKIVYLGHFSGHRRGEFANKITFTLFSDSGLIGGLV